MLNGRPDNDLWRLRLPYFAFGANMCRDSMVMRAPTARFLGPATLREYRLVFRGVADIEQSESNVVYGALWSARSADIAHLDMFEGYPKLYHAKRIIVQLGDKAVPAWAYIMAHGRSEYPPSQSYADTLLDGYVACGWADTRPEADRVAEKTWSTTRVQPPLPLHTELPLATDWADAFPLDWEDEEDEPEWPSEGYIETSKTDAHPFKRTSKLFYGWYLDWCEVCRDTTWHNDETGCGAC